MRNVLVVTDLSGVGRCSLGVTIPILSVMHNNVLPLTTGMFSCQTGFDSFHFLPNMQLTQFFNDITRYQELSAIYVGFMTDINQLNEIMHLVSSVDKGKTLLLVDPIMADNGKLYPLYDMHYVATMRQLVSGAYCITPNLTEACLLCGVDYEQLTATSNQSGYIMRVSKIFQDILTKLNVQRAVITGVVGSGFVGNIVYEKDKVQFVTNELIEGSFSGTGDMFASVLVGKLLQGESLYQAVTRASQFVYSSIACTPKDADRRKGTDFQRKLYTLIEE